MSLPLTVSFRLFQSVVLGHPGSPGRYLHVGTLGARGEPLVEMKKTNKAHRAKSMFWAEIMVVRVLQ